MQASVSALRNLKSEQRVYTFDFSLQPEIVNGDTIASATVTVSPNGAGDVAIGTIDFSSGNTVTVELSAGNPGTTYQVTSLRNDERGFHLAGDSPLQRR